MSNIDVKWVTDKVTGEPIFPITHIDAVRDDDGNPLSDYLNNEEVEIGDTAPTGDPKIFVNESADPSDSDLLDFYTQEETDAMIAAKADKSTTYTKTEVDNKIATAPEQSTMSSTDFVVLKDADNVNRKISKANIMGVVKDALADLLRNNDLGTNFSNVPALGANAFGSSTISNFASVISEDIFGIAHSRKLVFKEEAANPLNIAKDYFNNLSLNYYGELFVIASSNAFIKVWKADAHNVGRIEIKYIGSGATDVYKRSSTDSDFVKV